MFSASGAHQSYLASVVLTASPAQRHVLLIDGVLRHASRARELLVTSQPNEARAALLKAQDLLSEMISSLDPEAAPELVARLRSLYDFVLTSFARAGSEERVEPLDEGVRIMHIDRDTWRELDRRMTESEHVPTPHSLELSRSESFSTSA